MNEQHTFQTPGEQLETVTFTRLPTGGLMRVECECSEDFGPCERHMTVLAQREGASTRTADALALVFLYDVADLIDDARGFKDIKARDIADGWRDDATWSGTHPGDGWIEHEDDDHAEIGDDVSMVETWLPGDMWVAWDDGYVISRMSDDCPLRADYDMGNAPTTDDPQTTTDDATRRYEDMAKDYR